jgi:hypothetical protein
MNLTAEFQLLEAPCSATSKPCSITIPAAMRDPSIFTGFCQRSRQQV